MSHACGPIPPHRPEPTEAQMARWRQAPYPADVTWLTGALERRAARRALEAAKEAEVDPRTVKAEGPQPQTKKKARRAPTRRASKR